MNDQPRQKLCELIVRHGTSLCEEAGRCEGILRDYCAQHRGEVNVLVNALKEGVAADLLRASESMPIEVVLGRLAKRLREHQGMAEETARWAVESWALALGKISQKDILPALSVTITTLPAPVPAVAPLTQKGEAQSQPELSIPTAGTVSLTTGSSVQPTKSNRLRSVVLILVLLAGIGAATYYFQFIVPKAEEMRRDKEWQEQLAKEAEAAHEAKDKADADEKQRLQMEVARLVKEKAEEEERQRQMEINALRNATKDNPFTNSLGMRFVPVPGTKVLFCIHDTRKMDYQKYVEASNGGDGLWRNVKIDGVTVNEGDDHPVVMVNWVDAKEFCAWLSSKEGRTYRLPTDHEWSVAVGIGDREDELSTPKSKSGKIENVYPWGLEWPPPKGAGNYEDGSAKAKFHTSPMFEGYTDGYAATSPVMSFAPNPLGLYDMGGNVWQWCEDWYDTDQKHRVTRGASFLNSTRARLLSSHRSFAEPDSGVVGNGFRCVLVLPSSGN